MFSLTQSLVRIFSVDLCQLNVSSKITIGFVKTFNALGVLKFKVISSPTPICGGVKDKLVNKNSNGSTLLLVVRVLTSSVSFLIGSMLFSTNSTVVTSTGTIEIQISRGSISKLVPSLSGLIGFVITTSCCFYLE
jgi:hypothetical protein